MKDQIQSQEFDVLPWLESYADFDYDEIDRRLAEPVRELGLKAEERQKLAGALRLILRFILGGQYRTEHAKDRIVRRAISVQWIVDPKFFQDCPSLTQLAAHLGIHKVQISPHAVEAARLLGIRNLFQERSNPNAY